MYWRTKGLLSSAKCARCLVKEQGSQKTCSFPCQTCGKQTGLEDCGSVALTEWLTLGRRQYSHCWICFGCQLPRCALCEHENR